MNDDLQRLTAMLAAPPEIRDGGFSHAVLQRYRKRRVLHDLLPAAASIAGLLAMLLLLPWQGLGRTLQAILPMQASEQMASFLHSLVQQTGPLGMMLIAALVVLISSLLAADEV